MNPSKTYIKKNNSQKDLSTPKCARKVSWFDRQGIDLVSENDESKVVDVVDIILLDIDPVHVHEDVTDHDHRCLVVIPGLVQCLKEVVV